MVVIPERFPSGALTPCAYIRLLQPLDHPAIGGDFDIVLADAAGGAALPSRHHRHAALRGGRPGCRDALIRHCRERNIALLYDLDDDLRHIPRDHPDARLLRPRARLVSRLVRDAGAVWVSTPALAGALADLRDDVRVVENGLDERLWAAGPPPAPPRQGPVRILFMGTATHDADFAIVEGALAQLKSVFAEHVSVDILGISGRPGLPSWVNRIGMPVHATSSYPGLRQLVHAAALGHRHRAARGYRVQSLQVGDQGARLRGARSAGAGIGARGVSRHAGRRPRRLVDPGRPERLVRRARPPGARSRAAAAPGRWRARRLPRRHAGGAGGQPPRRLVGPGSDRATAQRSEQVARAFDVLEHAVMRDQQNLVEADLLHAL